MEEAILSEDTGNRVCAGDSLIIYIKWATSGSDFPTLERGSFRFWVSVGLLAGSHLTGTYYNYLKPYSLFIPHFVRVVCRLAWSVCIGGHFSGNLLYQGLDPLNANFTGQPQARLRHWIVVHPGSVSRVSHVPVCCLSHHGIIVLPFQIIANHCHTSYLDVLKLLFWMKSHHLTHKSELININVSFRSACHCAH